MQEISIIYTDQPNVALMIPTHLRTIPINHEVQGNWLLAADRNQVTLTKNKTTPIQITSSSRFCDKKRTHDRNNVNWGCGWWGVLGLGGSNITPMHIVVSRPVSLKILMYCF